MKKIPEERLNNNPQKFHDEISSEMFSRYPKKFPEEPANDLPREFSWTLQKEFPEDLVLEEISKPLETEFPGKLPERISEEISGKMSVIIPG